MSRASRIALLVGAFAKITIISAFLIVRTEEDRKFNLCMSEIDTGKDRTDCPKEPRP